MRSYCVGKADNQIHASPERGGGSAQAEPEGSIRVKSGEWSCCAADAAIQLTE